jgi:hypothetical protein
MDMPDVRAFGGLNIWAMLKSLVNNNVGLLTTSGAPTNGTSGTYAGYGGPSSVLFDYTNGRLYINTGTKASPVWTSLGNPVSGENGLGVVGNAKATYDFAVDGGATGEIIPLNSPTIPDNAIILGGTLDITAQLTSSDAATIAVGTSAGSAANSLKAATAVASWTVGQLAIVPVFTAATYVKMTAAGRPSLTVADFDLTAGKFDINLVYIVGN